MQDLRINIIQTALHWENIDKNLSLFDEKITAIKDQVDLVILPEMFTTGFSMNAKQVAEETSGKTIKWMAQKAKEKEAVIMGSVIIKEHTNYYNRLIWMQPDGNYQTYDKRHLFRMGREEETYTAGKKRLIVEWKGWRICPQVCYDLRFPVWNRNVEHYDLLIFIANWPERRNMPWKILLQARAIENQAYVIGLNRVGNDGNEIYYSGDSSIIDPAGEILFQQSHKEVSHTITLSKNKLKESREKLPFLQDADKFIIKAD